MDGESHRPVDLLPNRTAEGVAAWLQTHPGVEVITRDRSTEYARGVSQGAPDAVQVADRWHVLVNLREAMERMLDRCRPQLMNDNDILLPTDYPDAPLSSYDRSRRRGTKDQAQQQSSRARRHTRYIQVKALQAQGRNILQIARDLNLSRQTVRTYVASDVFPEIARPPRRKGLLDPYVPYLQARWDAGCQESKQLWRELRERGYPGSLRMVWLWVALRCERHDLGRAPTRQVEVSVFSTASPGGRSATATLPASRRLVWLLIHPTSELELDQQRLRQRLLRLPGIDRAHDLSQRFLTLVRQRQADAFQPWIDACRDSGVVELASFAQGLQSEFPIIHSALSLPFSNGVTEGHVNRLKFIKRSMYGRARACYALETVSKGLDETMRHQHGNARKCKPMSVSGRRS